MDLDDCDKFVIIMEDVNKSEKYRELYYHLKFA